VKPIVVLASLAATLLFSSDRAQAAITCSVSSPGFSTAYTPSNPSTNITQTSVTVTCQRNAAGDATSVTYNIAVDNGLNASAQQDRARLGATTSYIFYEAYRDSGCNNIWKQASSSRITGTISGLSGFIPIAQTTAYWGCVPAGQTGLAAGTYIDTVTMTLSYGGATNPTATFPVAIYTPGVCNLTTSPGTIQFTYVALGAAAPPASTTFGVTCTNFLPYTMALDATTGVLVGLQYSLALSATSATGTGLQQSYSIDGTMPAGQAGTCAAGSCSGTQARTLTITY
jgi:spore coat protein U-like protein